MDEDTLNMSVRKFLKRVGVTSQREIETAVRAAEASGRLGGAKNAKATMTLSVPDLGLTLVIDEDLELG